MSALPTPRLPRPAQPAVQPKAVPAQAKPVVPVSPEEIPGWIPDTPAEACAEVRRAWEAPEVDEAVAAEERRVRALQEALSAAEAREAEKAVAERIPIGSLVQIIRSSPSDEYNGDVGTVKRYDVPSGKYTVALQRDHGEGELIEVVMRERNLQLVWRSASTQAAWAE